MSFGKNLLSLRKAKGLSQDELGAQLNVSRQTISKWELNETTPELAKLILLSEYFAVSIDELVKGKKSTPKAYEHTLDIEVTETKKEHNDIVSRLLKLAIIVIVALISIDAIVMIIYFLTNGFPSI